MFVMPVLRCCSGMLNRKIYFLEMLSRPNIFCGKNLQVKNKLAWKNKLIVFLVASDGLYSIYSVPNTYIVGSLSGPMLVYVCFPKRKEAETCDEAINVYFYTKKFVWEGRTIYYWSKQYGSSLVCHSQKSTCLKQDLNPGPRPWSVTYIWSRV